MLKDCRKMLEDAQSLHIIVFWFWVMWKVREFKEIMAFVYSDVRLTKLSSILAYYRNYLGE